MTSSTENLFAAALEKAATEDAPAPAVEATEAPEAKPDELSMLKQRARLMGLKFSNNIGLDALRDKVNAKAQGEAEAEEDDQEDEDEAPVEQTSAGLTDAPASAPTTVVRPTRKLTVEEQRQKEREEMVAEQMKLVRLRITNLNPNKKDLPGEIFTVANNVLGTVRKFVPYGEQTDNGFHVPYWIYTQLKEREFVNIRTRKDSRGREFVETTNAREFSLEILPQLTEVELNRLAAAQAAAAGLD